VQEAAKKVLKLEKARAEAPTAASKKTLEKKVEQAKKKVQTVAAKVAEKQAVADAAAATVVQA
tara:strand:+ start:1334 stop:1522 length:189 start_codon:yes stop_codon:yes gene_type:complete